MIYITQLIFLREGQEAVFEAFEDMAIPLIAKHGGELLLRIRPNQESFISVAGECPYEVHLVSFPDEPAFQSFLQDDTRRAFLHLKEASVSTSFLVKGQPI